MYLCLGNFVLNFLLTSGKNNTLFDFLVVFSETIKTNIAAKEIKSAATPCFFVMKKIFLYAESALSLKQFASAQSHG